MSRLAELLQSRSQRAATSATQQPGCSHCSESSSAQTVSALCPTLERRIHTMAQRWRYKPEELAEVLALARQEPAKWGWAVALDEQREAEFRSRRLLPDA